MVFIAFQLCGTDGRIESNILIAVGSAIYFSENQTGSEEKTKM